MDHARTLRLLGLAGLALLAACTRPNPAFRPEWDNASTPVVPHPAGAGGGAGSGGAGPSVDMVNNAPAYNLDTGLLGFWTFEETGGTAVTNHSGAGHHGVLENLDGQRARVVPGGQRGQSLDFPGSAVNPGVLVTLPLASPLRTLERYTIAGWTYRASFIADVLNVVISRQLGTGTKQVWNLAFEDDHLMTIQSQETSGNALRVDANVLAPLNRWVHVAATYDGTELRLYQDGQLVGSAASAWTFARVDNPVYIGTNKNVNNDEPMVGMLDDVLVYGVALPPGAIKALADGFVPQEK